ncbi:MAG: hypothetical protein ACX939_11235, partial [Hyphococcus sp.]
YTIFAETPNTIKFIPAQAVIPGDILFYGFLAATLYFFVSFCLSAASEYARYDYAGATEEAIEQLNTWQMQISEALSSVQIIVRDIDFVVENLDRERKGIGRDELKQVDDLSTIQCPAEVKNILVKLQNFVTGYDYFKDKFRSSASDFPAQTRDMKSAINNAINSFKHANTKHQQLEGIRLRWWDYRLTLWASGATIILSVLAQHFHVNFFEVLTKAV